MMSSNKIADESIHTNGLFDPDSGEVVRSRTIAAIEHRGKILNIEEIKPLAISFHKSIHNYNLKQIFGLLFTF